MKKKGMRVQAVVRLALAAFALVLGASVSWAFDGKAPWAGETKALEELSMSVQAQELRSPAVPAPAEAAIPAKIDKAGGKPAIECASPWLGYGHPQASLSFELDQAGFPVRMTSRFNTAVGTVGVQSKLIKIQGSGEYDGEYMQVAFNTGTPREVVLRFASPEYKTSSAARLLVGKGFLPDFPNVTTSTTVTIHNATYFVGQVPALGILNGMNCQLIK